MIQTYSAFRVAAVLLAALLPLKAAELVTTALREPARLVQSDLGGPVLLSITKGKARVHVPAGFRRVLLEKQSPTNPLLWEPKAVRHLDGAETTIIEFPVGRAADLLRFRVRGYGNDPLPGGLFAGSTNFLQQVAPASQVRLDRANPPVFTVADGGTISLGGTGAVEGRQVTESDIWQLRGNTLYFFNQYRGLQIFDVSDPDDPALKGTVRLAASGEQMYVIGDTAVALITSRWTYSNNGSELVIVDSSGPAPRISGRLPIAGSVIESRLVGDALYVASNSYRSAGEETGQIRQLGAWNTTVASFDFSNPIAPVARDTVSVSGTGNVVAATDRFLFVATNDWRASSAATIHIIDISAPDGTMRSKGMVEVDGTVADKFKMNLRDNIFSVVAQRWRKTAGEGWQAVTQLTTFDLDDAAHPSVLGQLEIGEGESLFGTRFDDDRLYIVTFFQIDPLWIVDLSDPRKPAVTGHLEVPGFSTYLRPLGDRLLTVGRLGAKVALSLFDVADPAAPTLLTQLPLGTGYTYSEADSDEKALGVLLEQGLVLVPFTGSDESHFPGGNVQLVDLNRDALVKRGVIRQDLVPRRTMAHQDRILAVSGTDLVTVDVGNRDHPRITSDVEISWTVDRVFVEGDYLIQINNGSAWNATVPTINVGAAGDPDTSIGHTDLASSDPILGATVRDGRLYLLQGRRSLGRHWLVKSVNAEGTVHSASENSLTFSVYDLSALPVIRLLGRSNAPAVDGGWNLSFRALWPKPGLLVWAGQSQGLSWSWEGISSPRGTASSTGLVLTNSESRPTLSAGRVSANAAFSILPERFRPYGGGKFHLMAFDVSTKERPTHLSTIEPAAKGSWNMSEGFAANSLVYFSSYREEAVLDENAKEDWLGGHYLHVIDYAQPSQPAVRPEVNIPAQLVGVAGEGTILYTSGTVWEPAGEDSWDGSYQFHIDASAFDGQTARLLDMLSFEERWSHPHVVIGETLFLGTSTGQPGEAKESSLQSWVVGDNEKLQLLDEVQLQGAVTSLHPIGPLLVARTSGADDGLAIFTIDASSHLESAAVQSSGNWWPFQLEDAAVESGRALWIPMGAYGVAEVPLSEEK